MTLDEMYLEKGKLTTNIEVAQARLRAINEQIVNEINKVGNNGKERSRPVDRDQRKGDSV